MPQTAEPKALPVHVSRGCFRSLGIFERSVLRLMAKEGAVTLEDEDDAEG